MNVATSSNLDVVFFYLRGLRCALPASVVREMLPMPGLTPVPLAPPVMRGIAPVHGQVLPVLDLGVYFPQAGEAHGDGLPDPVTAERLILIETAPDANTPVIAAGSTGSMPATAKLLETIARLPHGALVLPGLDTDLDDAVVVVEWGEGLAERLSENHLDITLARSAVQLQRLRADYDHECSWGFGDGDVQWLTADETRGRGAALLARKPSLTRADAQQALAGNLCRCGTHERILRAMLRASQKAAS